MSYCTQCGKKLTTPDAKFCPNCGARLHGGPFQGVHSEPGSAPGTETSQGKENARTPSATRGPVIAPIPIGTIPIRAADKRSRGGLIAVIVAAVLLLAGVSGVVFAVMSNGAGELPVVGRFFAPEATDVTDASDTLDAPDARDSLAVNRDDTDKSAGSPIVEPTDAASVESVPANEQMPASTPASAPMPAPLPSPAPTPAPAVIPSQVTGYVNELPSYDDRVVLLNETGGERTYLIYSPLYQGLDTGYYSSIYEGGFAYTVTVPKPLVVEGGQIIIPGEFETLHGTQNGLKFTDNVGALVYASRESLHAFFFPQDTENSYDIILSGVDPYDELDVLYNYFYLDDEDGAYVYSAAADLKNGYAPQIVFYAFPGLTPNEWNDFAIFDNIMASIKPYGGAVPVPFTPAESPNEAVETLVGNYLNGLANAVTYKDFSLLSDYIYPGSPHYAEQERYISNVDAYEELLGYDILEIKFVTDDQCTVVVNEKFVIENYARETPPTYYNYRSTYTLLKVDGRWYYYILDSLERLDE
jgi:hypothetical protein